MLNVVAGGVHLSILTKPNVCSKNVSTFLVLIQVVLTEDNRTKASGLLQLLLGTSWKVIRVRVISRRGDKYSHGVMRMLLPWRRRGNVNLEA
eukprot:scaffold42446_cov191-Amphora_coffeaeformis.AAC.4